LTDAEVAELKKGREEPSQHHMTGGSHP
jgi:hypothetical protein